MKTLKIYSIALICLFLIVPLIAQAFYPNVLKRVYITNFNEYLNNKNINTKLILDDWGCRSDELEIDNSTIVIDYARYWRHVIGRSSSITKYNPQPYIVLVLESKEDIECFYQFLKIAKKNNMNINSINDATFNNGKNKNVNVKAVPNLIIQTIDTNFIVKTIANENLIKKIKRTNKNIMYVLLLIIITIILSFIIKYKRPIFAFLQLCKFRGRKITSLKIYSIIIISSLILLLIILIIWLFNSFPTLDIFKIQSIILFSIPLLLIPVLIYLFKSKTK